MWFCPPQNKKSIHKMFHFPQQQQKMKKKMVKMITMISLPYVKVDEEMMFEH